ncbi:membrane protein insertion efficiency factor YidD [[Phormidium] sp. LEGE 05292]|uniref:membrane protein insertion efficiency factor YidD n=1 Tax=[Phormidium] sp. LEGE 05292 TaxID=767427 RepID=UPI001D1515F0|nr:membrane protein insertion efficiency factor YidD [Phormidium sp. LEGE 05292]
MNTTWVDSGIRQIACTSISGYQKYLSPHKGFSCAHRILYGGESCSAYIKRIVAQKGL